MWAKTKGMAFNSGKALGSAMTHGTRAASISFLILMKLYLEPGFGKALAIVLWSSDVVRVLFAPPKPLTTMRYSVLALVGTIESRNLHLLGCGVLGCS